MTERVEDMEREGGAVVLGRREEKRGKEGASAVLSRRKHVKMLKNNLIKAHIA